MGKNLKKIILIVLSFTLAFSSFTGCRKKADNESTPFVIAVDELDGVFNPFFYTSVPDRNVLSYINIGLLTSNKDGDVVAGDNLPSVAKAIKETPADPSKKVDNPTDASDYFTTYEFLIKNGLKFSDGSSLTVDDVLFNLYVYLDPVYSGSSTLYSTNIRGLAKYRTQSANTGSQDNFEGLMREYGIERVEKIRTWTLGEQDIPSANSELGKDIAKVEELFKEELTADWTTAQGAVEDYAEYGIQHGWQAYLLMTGMIRLDEDDVLQWGSFANYSGNTDKDSMINTVYNLKLSKVNTSAYKTNLREVITYWATSQSALNYFIADEKTKWFEEHKKADGSLEFPTVEGITVNRNATSFDGQSLSEPHAVLKIVINGVDPKAIYNFGIPVVPRKYYSTQTALEKQAQDPDKNFGVEVSSIDFMNKVVKGRNVPIGAGAYKVTSDSNKQDETQVSYNEFFNNNVCYLQRNENFLLGKPTIKYLRYQVVNQDNVFEQVKQGKIHYAEVEAKTDTINKVSAEKNLDSKRVLNPGYGYIGINPKFIEDINLRRAIMSAMDISKCLNYYSGGLAELIYRPMSKTNWAYPQGSTAYYEFSTAKVESYLKAAGYYDKGGKKYVHSLTDQPFKTTFTIAGTGDHPMKETFYKAKEVLEELGCVISVKQDANALSKLASGNLEVWAAAWSSTIDPDMYQVYHKDSSASAVFNWGYPSIFANPSKFDREIEIINRLSQLIEDGRATTDRNSRIDIYSRALDEVMKLAVELPTYQRNNLFIFNSNIINVSTMTPNDDISAYNDPISRLWELSYN